MFSRKIRFSFLILFFVCVALTPISPQPVMAKEEKYIFAHFLPPSYKDLFPVLQAFVDYINENGKGKVHIDHFHSGTMLKQEEMLPGLMQGTADIIFQMDSAIMGTYPILGITELPFLYPDMPTSFEKLKIGSPLFNLINEELGKKNLYMAATWAIFPAYIWTHKPIYKVEDLKGLRIRGAGRVEAQVIKAFGAAPATVTSAELYEALKRKTVDGTICPATTVVSRGFQETIQYQMKYPMAGYSAEIYMRRDTWDKMPSDVKKIFTEAGKLYGKLLLEHSVPMWNKDIWPAIRKAGIKETVPTKSDLVEFQKRALPVWEWWKDLLPSRLGEKAIKLATE